MEKDILRYHHGDCNMREEIKFILKEYINEKGVIKILDDTILTPPIEGKGGQFFYMRDGEWWFNAKGNEWYINTKILNYFDNPNIKHIIRTWVRDHYDCIAYFIEDDNILKREVSDAIYADRLFPIMDKLMKRKIRNAILYGYGSERILMKNENILIKLGGGVLYPVIDYDLSDDIKTSLDLDKKNGVYNIILHKWVNKNLEVVRNGFSMADLKNNMDTDGVIKYGKIIKKFD